MINHAVIGTDFSKAVSQIIDHSGMFQTLGINKISLIHVFNLRDLSMLEASPIEDVEQKLANQKDSLSHKGFDLTSEIIYGVPHIELEKRRRETGAGLIIIGSQGKTGSGSIIGGNVADILQNIKAPVLVIPLDKRQSIADEFPGKNLYQYEQLTQKLQQQEPDWVLKCNSLVDNILITTDFSDFSEKAFQWIRDQNIKLPKVTLLHVQDEVKIGKHLKHKLDEFNRIDTERLVRITDSFRTSHPETDINFEIIYGKPTEVILNFIKENSITMTVMGSQGKGYFKDIFIGSVSHQVVRNSDSNVMIIPFEKE